MPQTGGLKDKTGGLPALEAAFPSSGEMGAVLPEARRVCPGPASGAWLASSVPLLV